jgi:hypothetical protein
MYDREVGLHGYIQRHATEARSCGQSNWYVGGDGARSLPTPLRIATEDKLNGDNFPTHQQHVISGKKTVVDRTEGYRITQGSRRVMFGSKEIPGLARRLTPLNSQAVDDCLPEQEMAADRILGYALTSSFR